MNPSTQLRSELTEALNALRSMPTLVEMEGSPPERQPAAMWVTRNRLERGKRVLVARSEDGELKVYEDAHHAQSDPVLVEITRVEPTFADVLSVARFLAAYLWSDE